MSRRLRQSECEQLLLTMGETFYQECDANLLTIKINDATTAAILHLEAMGNVHTTTCRAFTAVEMDKIVSKVHGDK